MTTWIVSRPTVIGTLEAPDRTTAEQLAHRRFGDEVAVQSAISYRISDEERASVARQRLLREDDGA